MQNRDSGSFNNYFNQIAILALAGLIAAVLVLASVPPVDRDALTHHLAVPKLYLTHGRIYEIPHVPFSYYPMNLDLLYLVPLSLGSDIAPKYIHYAFALLTAGLVFSYLRRRFEDRFYALLGGLMFLSLPVIVKLSVTVYVDLGLIFFSTASLLQLLRWVETHHQWKHLALAGLFAGLCLGTKPNGALSFFFLMLAVPFLYRSKSGAQSPLHLEAQRALLPRGIILKPLGWSVFFAGIAMLVYSPWMLRNYTWTGNPVYPMAISIFGPVTPAHDETRAIGAKEMAETENAESHSDGSEFGHFAIRKMVFNESLWEILAIPIRIFFQGRDDDPRLFDGRLNPYLLILPLIAVFPLKGRSRSLRLELEIRLIGLFAVLYLVFAFFLVDMRIRYIGPIIPPLTILAVVGMHDLIGIVKARCSLRNQLLALSAIGAVFICLLGLNLSYLVGQFGIVDPMSYLQGKLPRDEYIQKYRPEYAALSFANANLPEEARILALFNGNRIYYSDREMICDNESFRRAVSASQSPADLVWRLAQGGISHLLVRLDLFNQWADNQFQTSEKQLLKSFFREKLLRLYQGHGYALFAVTAG